MTDVFSSAHPAVNLIFFLSVILFPAFVMHPIILALSLAGAIFCAVGLKGIKAVKFAAVGCIPMILLIMLINPLFNHEGSTILAYFPSGNPLTAESLIYGGASALMTAGIFMWFYCFSAVMTSDKIICVFGRVFPSLSLVISMTLRFVPKFAADFIEVKNAQKSMGCDMSKGNIFERIKKSSKVLSVTVSRAMENSAQTADSMRSRGYGLPGRSSYSIYRFRKSDLLILIFSVSFIAVSIAARISGSLEYGYFPAFYFDAGGTLCSLSLALYAILCFLPFILHIAEVLKWKFYQSKI